ncbi:hypothetical protein GCM10010222_19970 [Streptomyces tanashiensis]|nr:hypothetical protein GCM10010222_19970 [Streptomyces tanashiensis]
MRISACPAEGRVAVSVEYKERGPFTGEREAGGWVVPGVGCPTRRLRSEEWSGVVRVRCP